MTQCYMTDEHDVRLSVIPIAGQIGVAPVPGTCATASTDTNSSCPVEVVRGGNLQLCIEHKTHPSDEHQTVEVDGAGWTDGTRRLVGCNAELCRNINVNPNYSSSGQWAKCLSVVSVTRSVNITYWITVNPDSTYPSDSPVSKTFTFAVRVVDASESPAQRVYCQWPACAVHLLCVKATFNWCLCPTGVAALAGGCCRGAVGRVWVGEDACFMLVTSCPSYRHYQRRPPTL